MNSVADVEAGFHYILNEVKQQLKGFNAGPSVLDSFQAFVAAVDWKEPWIVSLVAFQAFLLSLALFGRRNLTLQGVVFFTAMGLVYFAERINKLGAQHWKKFSAQNYFDGAGIFTSAVLSGPLLITMVIILINYLITASQLLIKMKAKEIRYKAKERLKAERAGAAGASTAPASKPASKKDA